MDFVDPVINLTVVRLTETKPLKRFLNDGFSYSEKNEEEDQRLRKFYKAK